jgi:predicted O-linked N-acetylglucosamine transferase (SPINDLY family)
MTAQLQQSPARHSLSPLAPRLRRAERAWQEGLRWANKGQHAAASQAFRRALSDAPADAASWMHLARSELRLGHTTACHAASRKALACVDLSNWTLAYGLVALFQKVQDPAGVLEVLDGHAAGREHTTMGADWQIEYANSLTELRRSDAALEYGMAALTSSMQGDAGSAAQRSLRHRAALLNGHNLVSLKRYTEAAICYRMAVDAEPLSVGCALYAAHYSAWTCDWAQLKEDIDRLQGAVLAVDALPAGCGHEELSPFSLIGLSDDPVLMRWAAEHANRFMAGRSHAAARPLTAVPRPAGRLRIGLLSSDFYLHATAILMAQMLESVDPTRYELYFYDNGQDDGTAMRRRLLASATQVHTIFSWSDDQVIEQIRADQIGVLFDLKGFTNGARMAVLAARAAPLQVAWLGYPGTCGNAAIDYQIGDAVVTPLAHQDDFTECIAQLPCCYQPNDSTRSLPPTWSRAKCALPQDAVVLASFNQVYKITEPVFTAWCEVLLAVPHTVLWLLVNDELTQQRLRAYAGNLGVTPERLIFAPYADAESHRARIGQADLVLDTFPCGGHTTTSDLLWAGVPVLTLCGRTFAARVAASLLAHIGLPELVCESLDQYRDTAIALCQDELALPSLRKRVATGKADSALFDGKRFAQHWQDLIERMVARQDAGLPPSSLAAA